ncbi:MAG: ATP-binding protein, partial [Streptosporangiaceae bacterium]
ASSVLVAMCSIAAATWLTAQYTQDALRRSQGRALATDAGIYDDLVGYAAVHTGWWEAGPFVDGLAKRSGRRIVLTTRDRRPLIGSAPVSRTPNAVIDPLSVDPTLAPGGSIDPRVVGPFRLTLTERDRLRTLADEALTCMRGLRPHNLDARVRVGPSGRPSIVSVDGASLYPYFQGQCPSRLNEPVPTEQGAVRRLQDLADPCLRKQGVTGVVLMPDGTWAQDERVDPTVAGAIEACVTDARRELLTPSVAAPTLLFLGDDQPVFSLTASGTQRIVGVSLLVLMLTVAVSVLAAGRLTGPVRALTEAAQRMRAGDRSIRVRPRSGDEIGRLAVAFNDMSAHLERLESQRNDLVSDISHELRNPVSTIRSWLEAAQDGLAELDPALVSSLLEEIVLLQRLIEDLQELAMVENGGLRLGPEPLLLGDLLEQVATAYGAGGVTVNVEARPGLVLTADPARLRQAIGNLVSNAVRNTPAGGYVTLHARPDGPAVVIEVHDTGYGIEPTDLPYLFDRFWRADRSRSRQTGGSGLGLAIVRNLVEAHGGTVTATSTPGHGSTFTVRLPAA